ncbi:MAG: ABC transporter substrate-binding protein [Desulfomonile tiedjei]|nr:ABC transporter substrate-binding protein [Desulfomonile tiedjei]
MKRKTGRLESRRDFLKKVGLAGTAFAMTSALSPGPVARASKRRDHILVGLPNPSTGPLADFGEASPWANERALAAINGRGGIYVEEHGKKLPVRMKMVDTESDPTRAGEVAVKLILQDQIDLMVVLHTPDTVNPVAAICERYGMPCISLDAPVEAWMTGGPYKWCYHAFWTVDALTDLYIGMWDLCADRTNKVVGGFWPNDADGKEWSDLFKKKLPPRGYRVIDPGRFPHFTRDYTGFVNLFKKENVEIVTGVVIPPDWAAAWRQCRQLGFVPKVASIGKAILFPSAVQAIGSDLAAGLTSEVWWSPHHPFKSSLTGETAETLCEAWSKETGKPWTQPIGFKYAALEIAFDALSRAGSLDREKIRQAVAATDMDTIVGHIKYNDKHYAETPLVGGQWVKGKRWPWELEIIYNKGHREIPKTAELMFPIPVNP